MKRSRRVGWLLGTLVLALLFAPAVKLLVSPAERSYSFVPDHPVDLWSEGANRWAYYSVGAGEAKDLAQKVRPKLLAEGFNEDSSKKPWFRFVKGDQEILVCNHSDIGRDQSGHLLKSPRPAGLNPWQSVYVKNGPGTHDSLLFFKAKKLLHGW